MSFGGRHRKHESQGSKSLLSIDLFRGIGQGRSQSKSALRESASNLDVRIASGLSCNPEHQTPSGPGDNNSNPALGYTPSMNASATSSLRSLGFLRLGKTVCTQPDLGSGRRKSRLVSRRPFTRGKQHESPLPSSSMPIPQQSSMSSVRSTISSPVLTSTTNAQVAQVENIECSEALLPDYSSTRLIAAKKCNPAAQQSAGKRSSWSSTLRSVKKKLGHTRRASTSLLPDSPWIKPRKRTRGHCATPPASSSHVLRKKLQRWAGREQHRDSAGEIGSGTALVSTEDFPRTNDHTVSLHGRRAPRLPGLYSDSTTELLATSLSRSFTSAVEKLDFESSPTLVHDGTPVSRLKKAKSLWSLNKFMREVSQRSLDRAELSSHTTSADQLSDNRNQRQLRRPNPCDQSGSQIAQQTKTAVSKPVQLRFSGLKNRYIETHADGRTPSGVNPLTMHPEVTTFGKSTVPRLSTPGPDGFAMSTWNEDERRQSGALDRAIIYSPSTGDLSEYSRTPSPLATRNNNMLRERPPEDTPTKKPLHERSRSVLKRSVSTLFGRSASMMKIGSFSPLKWSKTELSLASVEKRASWPHVPGLTLKRGGKTQARSMSTSDMFGKDSIRAAWDYQPSTPSPLRKSTHVTLNEKGRRRAVTTTTPVRVSSGGLTLGRARSTTMRSEPEKRYARYVNRSTDDLATIYNTPLS